MDFDYPDVPVETGRHPVPPAEEFFGGIARGLVDVQAALDEPTGLSMTDSEENGIPPSGLCRISIISSRMDLLSLPVAVSSVLTTALRFASATDFLQSDSRTVADVLTSRSNLSDENRMQSQHVDCRKKETGDYLAVKVPCPIVN
jgi:hypothetical protein